MLMERALRHGTTLFLNEDLLERVREAPNHVRGSLRVGFNLETRLRPAEVRIKPPRVRHVRRRACSQMERQRGAVEKIISHSFDRVAQHRWCRAFPIWHERMADSVTHRPRVKAYRPQTVAVFGPPEVA